MMRTMGTMTAHPTERDSNNEHLRAVPSSLFFIRAFVIFFLRRLT